MSHQPSHPSTRGFTLLEMSIATLLLVMACTAVFETLNATRDMASHAEAINELDENARLALREISNDLTASGWEFVDTPTGSTRMNIQGTVTSTGLTPAGDYSATALGGGAAGMTADRARRYYPFVQLDNENGLRFPWTELAAGTLPLRQPPQPKDPFVKLPGARSDLTRIFGTAGDADWKRSFFARSQNLIFLRSQIGAWNQTLDPAASGNRWESLPMTEANYAKRRPSARTLPALNFSYAYSTKTAPGATVDVSDAPTGTRLTADDWRTPNNHAKLGVLLPSGFVQDTTTQAWDEIFPSTPYGVVLDSGWFDPNDGASPIKPLWEPMNKLKLTENFFGTPAQDLREFMYAVVPSTIPFSLGRLVRAYRVPDGAAYPTGSTDPGYRITAIAADEYLLPPAGSPSNSLNCFVQLPSSATPDPNPSCAMIVDRVLAENVVRAVFDTYRTVDAGEAVVSELGVNQVRARLYLARRQISNPDIVVHHVAESTVAMRVRGSSAEISAISSVLGSVPVGISR